MRMVTFELARAGQLSRTDDEVLRDILWAHTRRAEQVEHICVRGCSDQIRVVLFLLAPDQLAAEEVARGLRSRVRALPAFGTGSAIDEGDFLAAGSAGKTLGKEEQ